MTLEDKEDAEKCIILAQRAFSLANVEKAERFLLRAEKLYPTEEAKNLLTEVRAVKSRSSKKDQQNVSKTNRKNVSHEAESDAEKCISIALIAMNVGDLRKAKRFLEKAEKFQSTEQAKSLLEQINVNQINQDQLPDEHTTGNSDWQETVVRYSSKHIRNDTDDVEKCLDIAIGTLHSGDLDKAEHFLMKAERMGPSERGKQLLQRVRAAKEAAGTSSGSRRIISNKNKNKKDHVKQEEPIRKECTVEQLEAVCSVRDAKNDFECLGVPEGSDLSYINHAHKRLTKLLHPDKNQTPEAYNAYMIMTAAAERLKNSFRPSKCGICFDVMLVSEALKKLPCSHDFHEDCINEWLDVQPRCPYCRKPV